MTISFSDIVHYAPGISAIVATATFLVGIVAFIKTLMEYTQQNSMKRFEKFQEMRKRYKEDPVLREICTLLEDDSERLRDMPFKQKLIFLGFYEEIALMHNSGLLRPSIAHYMFGYYAIRCYQSKNFWNNLNRDSYYWAVFVNFAKRMEAIDDKIDDDTTPKELERFRF
jgi:hypothetical protein